MTDSIILSMLLRMGISALTTYFNYKQTGILTISPALKETLKIYSQQEEILKLYNTMIEEIDKQLEGHK